jgi:hypothetical protein
MHGPSLALHTLALYCTPLPCRECGLSGGCGSNSTSCSKATGRSSGSRLQPCDLVPSGGSCKRGLLASSSQIRQYFSCHTLAPCQMNAKAAQRSAGVKAASRLQLCQ